MYRRRYCSLSCNHTWRSLLVGRIPFMWKTPRQPNLPCSSRTEKLSTRTPPTPPAVRSRRSYVGQCNYRLMLRGNFCEELLNGDLQLRDVESVTFDALHVQA